MLLIKPLHKEYRQLITQLTVSGHLLFFTVLLTGSTPVCTNPDFMHFSEKQHPDFMYFSANRHTDFMHFSTKQHPDFMHEGLTKAGNSGILSIVQESGVLGYVETKNV
ncbi:MAG: hypothetical protein J6Y20_00665 [Lachnospiraceae bacterium]|nr:hypothetical protein [Lachnospiraceae bacterium]